jgi:hypothetical protein
MDVVRKHYHKLGDWERFRLVIAAFARDDDDELRAIRETAPKADYRMTAWPYYGMVDALPLCVGAVCTDILTTGYIMSQAWQRWMYEPDAQWEHATDDGEPMNDFQFARAGADHIGMAYLGLMLFCDGLGVPFDQAMAQRPEFETAVVKCIVQQSERIQEHDADFRRWLAGQSDDDDVNKMLLEGVQRIETRQRERAETFAAELREAFDTLAGVDDEG